MNKIKDDAVKNFPIHRFSMGNLKHFLAAYNVCTEGKSKKGSEPEDRRRVRREEKDAKDKAESGKDEGNKEQVF